MTEDELMRALVAEIQSCPILGPDEVTIDRLRDAAGCTRRQAEVLLNGKVDRGELVVVKRFNPKTRREVNAYEKPALV